MTTADKRSCPGMWTSPNAAGPTYIVPPRADGEANHGMDAGQFSAALAAPQDKGRGATGAHGGRLLTSELVVLAGCG
jgi:hypothetical protein